MSLQLFWAIVGAAIVIGLAAVAAGAWYGVRRIRAQREARAVVAAIEGREAAALMGDGTEAVGTRSVDRIDITNWTPTGLKTQVDRYTMVLEFWWTENDGTHRHYGPATHTFPNDLAFLPLKVQREWAEQIIVQAVRYQLGIDPVPEP